MLLAPAREENFNLCQDLGRGMIGSGMRRVKGVRGTMSAYLGLRFVGMKEIFEVK